MDQAEAGEVKVDAKKSRVAVDEKKEREGKRGAR